MNKSINIPWWAIAVAIVLIYMLGNFNSNSSSDMNEDNLAALTAEMQTYKTKYNQEVKSKRSFVTTNKKYTFLNDSLKAVIKNFKKAHVVIREVIITKIDSVLVPYKVPVPFEFKRSFDVGDKYFNISGTSSHLGLKLDSIIFNNTQDIVFGEKKGGIFTVDITNTSPYVNTSALKSYTYQRKKHWYEKWYITIPAGIATGAMVFR